MKSVFDNIPLRHRLLAASASILFLAVAAAQEPTRAPAPPIDLPALLQRGLFEEEGRRRLDEAASAYEALLAGFDEQKHLAATALFRLAEVRRKQDRKDEAIALYQRLLAEFPASDPLARLSRENLAALGAPESQATPPATVATADASAADPAMSEEEAKELARVRALAETSPDLLNAAINRPGDGTTYPIIEACSKGWKHVVHFYLSEGVPVDIQGTSGRSPLSAAVQAGNKALCEYLFASGADIKKNPSALTLAAASGFSAIVDWLLENGADVNAIGTLFNGKIPYQTIPLIAALEQEQETVFQRLLLAKPDVNKAGVPGGMAPLHVAAFRGDAQAVKQLLELGADANAVASETGSGSLRRQFPVPQIPPPNQPKIVVPEIVKGEGDTPLLLAVKGSKNVRRSERAECVSLLLAAGAKADEPDAEGNTPLFLAIQMGDLAEAENITSQLAKAGADVSRAHPYQQSGIIPPLAVVLQRGPQSHGLAEILLAHGADPLQPGAANFTLVDYAHPSDYRAEWMRRFYYPVSAIQPTVWLSVPQAGWSMALAQRQTAEEQPPTLPTVLLSLDGSQSTSVELNWKGLAIWRKKEDGEGLARVEISMEPGAEPPDLRWGDIIELVSAQPGLDSVSVDSNQARGGPSLVPPAETKAWLKAHITRRITLAQDGKEYPLTLRGSRVIYDPTKGEAPLAPLRPLLTALGVWPVQPHDEMWMPRGEKEMIVIERAPAAGGGTVQVDLNSGLAQSMEIQEGDVLRLTASNLDQWRGQGCTLVSPGLFMAWTRFLAQERDNPSPDTYSEPTLLQFLASFYAPIPERAFTVTDTILGGSDEDKARRLLAGGYVHDRPVLPHPDWAKLRVRRMKDAGQEEIITPKLAEVLAAITAETSAEDARLADMPLQRRDIIELPVAADASGPWTGLDDTMRLLLEKALSIEITLVSEGAFRQMPLTYKPPVFVETSAGLLSLPAEPLHQGKVDDMLAGTALRSCFGPEYQLTGFMRRPEIAGKIASSLMRESQRMGQIYLRPGDQLEAAEKGGVASPANSLPRRERRILPAPAASQ